MRLLLALLSAALCHAETIPKIETKTVSGKPISLPTAASGKPAVLIFGFSQESDKQIEQWAKSLRAEQLTVYSIPVLESVPKLIRGIVASGIRSSTEPAFRDYMAPVFSGEAALKSLVQFKEPKDAYVVLLDATGNILFKGHGAAPETFQKFHAALPRQ
jgi:hypothetical protein